MTSPETLAIPRFSLVVLMGPSAAGKTTFARRWFPASSIVSADQCRWMVANDEHAEWASAEAFALLETWVTARLKLGQLVVVDSTALEPGFRMRMLDLAREFHAPAVLLAFDVPSRQCIERDASRGRLTGAEVIGRQCHRFFRALARTREEGWNRVIRLRGYEVDTAPVEIRPLRVDSSVPPPYDLIGDIHGCYRELVELIERLGYQPDPEAGYRHPQGRRIVFVGDMVDRGPSSLGVIQLAARMERAGTALVTPGNHDDKLLRYLTGGRVRLDHGLERTAAELEALEPTERSRVIADLIAWLRNLPPYLMLDGGKLVVAHAGLPENLQGRLSRAVAAWALFGDARNPRLPGTPPPTRAEWPITYQGRALVVYGHTPSAEARMRRNTICIDQGCVFGGKLTSYRYPEGEIVQVQAYSTYYPDDAPDLEGVAADAEEAAPAVTPPADGELGEADDDSILEGEIGPDGTGEGETGPGGDAGSTSLPVGGSQATPGGLYEPASTPGIRPSAVHGAVMRAGVLVSEGSLVGADAAVTGVTPATSGRSEGMERAVVGAKLDAETVHPAPIANGGAPAASIAAEPTVSVPAGPDGAGANGADPRGAGPNGSGPDGAGPGRLEPGSAAAPGLPDLLPLLSGTGLTAGPAGLVQLRAQQVSSALEEVARHGIDPRWLFYLPPSVAPCTPSQRPNYLEHPDEVFRYYRATGLSLIIEELHLSSRAVAIVGRDASICRERFGIDAPGVIHTRSGRPFFGPELMAPVLERLQAGLEQSGAFERLEARLLVFEVGVLPWSHREQEHVARRCVPAATALVASRQRALDAIELAARRNVPVKGLHEVASRDRDSGLALQRTLAAVCRPMEGIDSIRIAPFQLLATESRLLVGMDRLAQLEEIDRWCDGSGIFLPTRRMPVRGAEDERAVVGFWEELSAAGGGVVARTAEWLPMVGDRLELAAMKVRGREGLRLIYGPQYLSAGVLTRLKERPTRGRRAATLREWALAQEGLQRFVAGASFASYHPYALAVLASRSEQ